MRSLITASVTFFLFTGISLFYPELFLNPGQLSEQHDSIHSSCFSCHSVFKGTVSSKCISCHIPVEIDYKKSDGTILINERKVKFHDKLSEYRCTECHTGHYPVNGKYTKYFSHDLLPVEIINNCSDCHLNKPADNIHDPISGCAGCHKTISWIPAEFDHTLVSANIITLCIHCHKNDRPEDDIHSDLNNECKSCHKTDKWKPADFAHDDYFVFDRDHPGKCKNCHNNSYKAYTCYGCHEHTRATIRKKHTEEGITDFTNCVECHRSAEEHQSYEHKEEEDDDDD